MKESLSFIKILKFQNWFCRKKTFVFLNSIKNKNWGDIVKSKDHIFLNHF
ncbi:hypothetical protein LEP1GSC150_1372 [Leptospira interrogans serovar Copenhageni str. LT2050]|uniref:Uncharacterized protein n=1 Tax=Leptospira interrogans serovar Copenhageni str. LT2050 TaxID=1001598 RepID=M3IKJ3_LEPIT|nr:hypothetical protein LEP1GSC150_1372 [Leptospira interrogans serovar Copenhageni str. LT2050]